MAADTLAVDELIEDLKHLYPGRRRAPYDTEARMYDVIGKHATPYQGKQDQYGDIDPGWPLHTRLQAVTV